MRLCQLWRSRKMVQKIPQSGISGNRLFRNLIINGDMAIWQRYGGSAVTISDGSNEGYNSVDRWKMSFGSSAGGAVQWSRSTDVPTGEGFEYSLKVSPSTTANATGNHEVAIQHFIEAQNIPDISYGTSSAKKLTFSFYFKTNKVGLYSVYFQHPGSGTAKRKFLTFTPAASDTWERIVLTVTGDTAVAFPVNVSTYGLGIYIYLDNPPNYDVDATEADWQTSVVVASENNVNFMDNTSNELYMTGCQLEVSDSVSDFEFLPHDVQLQRCQRYLQRIDASGTDYGSLGVGAAANATSSVGLYRLNPNMRSVPTLVTTGTASDYTVFNGSTGVDACTSVPAINGGGGTSNQIRLEFISSGNLTNGQAVEQLGSNNVAAYLMFNAEL